MERKPDPMRAFEGLNIQEAKTMAEKMGYRLSIITGNPPAAPRFGEVGLLLDGKGKVSRAFCGVDRKLSALPAPKPTPVWPTSQYSRSAIPGIPWLSRPTRLDGPNPPPKVSYAPPAPDAPYDITRQCGICRARLNFDPMKGETFNICLHCGGNFCFKCMHLHTICKGKEVGTHLMGG